MLHHTPKTMALMVWQAAAKLSSAEAGLPLQDPTGASARALDRPDGVQLYVREFTVAAGTQQRGLVVMVHGWAWHSRHFVPLAKELTAAGVRGVATGSCSLQRVAAGVTALRALLC